MRRRLYATLASALMTACLSGSAGAECLSGDCIFTDPDWTTDSFRVTRAGSTRLYLSTNLFAQIVDEKGWSACKGGILQLQNNDRKYGALYNHLGSPPNMLIEPGQELLIPLPIYQSANDFRCQEVELALRYHPD